MTSEGTSDLLFCIHCTLPMHFLLVSLFIRWFRIVYSVWPSSVRLMPSGRPSMQGSHKYHDIFIDCGLFAVPCEFEYIYRMCGWMCVPQIASYKSIRYIGKINAKIQIANESIDLCDRHYLNVNARNRLQWKLFTLAMDAFMLQRKHSFVQKKKREENETLVIRTKIAVFGISLLSSMDSTNDQIILWNETSNEHNFWL